MSKINDVIICVKEKTFKFTRNMVTELSVFLRDFENDERGSKKGRTVVIVLIVLAVLTAYAFREHILVFIMSKFTKMC